MLIRVQEQEETEGRIDRVALMMNELEALSNHIKLYNTGAFPAFYLQSHTVLKSHGILDMHLSDIYCNNNGDVRVRSYVEYEGRRIELKVDDRRELAWYVLQRIQVKGVNEKLLQNQFLCVNKQGRKLEKQVYRKMLERSSNELDLSRVYNSVYLRSLYGYLEIAYGRKTIMDVAREYQVDRYYLLNRIFKGVGIEYAGHILDEVACI